MRTMSSARERLEKNKATRYNMTIKEIILDASLNMVKDGDNETFDNEKTWFS